MPTRSCRNKGMLYSEEGKHRRSRTVTFHHDTSECGDRNQDGNGRPAEFKIPPGTLDTLSALFAIRALPFREGLTLTMPVADGDDVYDVGFSVGPRETIDSALGPRAAWRVTPNVLTGTGQMKGRASTLDLGRSSRLPLRLEAEMPLGKFVVTLIETRG